MIEKYGVAQNELPPSDEQLRQIKKLCKEAGKPYSVPKNAEEADKLIEKLAAEI
jgi:hypothetical protein